LKLKKIIFVSYIHSVEQMNIPLKSYKLICSLAILLLVVSCGSNTKKEAPAKNRYEAFWQWFETKQDEYFQFEKNQTELFDSLDKKLSAIHPSITFVFGPVKEGKREFIISADGVKEAFIDVRQLVRAAPKFTKWEIIAFRPRLNPLVSVQFDGLIMDPDDIMIKYNYDKENKLIDLELYIKNYKESDQRFIGAAFIMLDNALGESDVETKIGAIEFKKLIQQKNNKNFIPLKELPNIVDSYFE